LLGRAQRVGDARRHAALGLEVGALCPNDVMYDVVYDQRYDARDFRRWDGSLNSSHSQ